jgi:hypothetical protein
MWSYDRTVTIEKPLVTAPWRSFGFYALTGKSTISFGKRINKETVCEALEEIHATMGRRTRRVICATFGW